MREERPIRPRTTSSGRTRIEIDLPADLEQVRSALDGLAAPLERVTSRTRLLAREQRQAHQQAIELARTLGRTLPAEADALERSFRRTFHSESGVRGILRSFVNEARRLLTELLEAWLGGTRALSTGGTGALFAGLGGTPPFLPGEAGLSSAFPRSRGSLGGLNLPQILSRLGINLRGIAGISGRTVFGGGLALGLLGHQLGGVGGAIVGAGGGALAGFAVGGPIGAIVGGIAGLLGGIFGGGRGQRKRAASEIANRGFEQIRELFFRYQQFRIDYAEALARMHQIWSEMEARWREIGGSVGRQSIASQRPFFDQILRAMEEIQRERQRRAGVLAGFPLPEFQAGGLVRLPAGAGVGFVGGSLGTRQSTLAGRSLVAVLHPGEFVMSRAAVEALGRARLETMNRQGAASESGAQIQVTIIAADAQGFEEMLRRKETSLL